MGTSLFDLLSDHVLEKIFSSLPVTDICRCSLVCKRWSCLLSNGYSTVWECQCKKLISPDILSSNLLNSCETFRDKVIAYFTSWNPKDCSKYSIVKCNDFTFHRNPIAQSTDGVRAKRGFSYGRHCWEIWFEGPLGTVAVIGVATKSAPVQCHGYLPLLGSNPYSWGWNLVDNFLIHNGEMLGVFPRSTSPLKYHVGEHIRVILDCELQTLSFERGCDFLGVAFTDLPKGVPLYPAVTAVYGNTEVSMVYIGYPLDG